MLKKRTRESCLTAILILSLLLPLLGLSCPVRAARLSDVENLPWIEEQLGRLNEKERALLEQEGFFLRLAPEELREQLFYLYEDNDYRSIPSFITTDAILHVYHVFFDFSLRKIEALSLLPRLKELNKGLLSALLTATKDLAPNTTLAAAGGRALLQLALAQLFLGEDLPEDFPKELQPLLAKERQRVETGSVETSAINGYDLDYSQFKPRGHYTRDKELSAYFRAMMLYGTVGLPLEDRGEFDKDSSLQALLLASVLQDQTLLGYWQDIYSLSALYAGDSDDLTPRQYLEIAREIFGETFQAADLMDEEKLQNFFLRAKAFPQPRVAAKYSEQDSPTERQFRLMGQRYSPDAEIMQALMTPTLRPIPQGLDILAALGSEEAEKILMADAQNQLWPNFPTELEKISRSMSERTEEEWKSNLQTGWLWALQAYINNKNAAYPPAMQGENWALKDLHSALASWAQLKHDTVLYGKQPTAELGGAEPPPILKSYVEPNIELYQRLKWLVEKSAQELSERQLMPEENGVNLLDYKFAYMVDTLDFLITVSEKELKGEALEPDEHLLLRFFGGRLESMMANFADTQYWSLVESDTDRNMATVADVATIAPNSQDAGGFVEAAVGPAAEIWIIVPIEGIETLCRGAAFSYFEFLQRGERLSDEEWQEMLKKGEFPPLQEWQRAFFLMEP